MDDEKKKLQDEMGDLGHRLALLLATSDLPDDAKEAWAVLIPEMNLQQIDQLTKILEGYVHSAAMKDLDGFKEDLAKIKQGHEEKVSEVNRNALSELDALEKELQG